MIKPLRILHLEDSPADAGLVEWQLKQGKFPFEIYVVDNRESYLHALETYSPDIILSDHSLPSFNSMEALKLVKEKGIPVPFILITATVSEEFAVDIMKKGAWDYILKDRLQRLPVAIINAYEKYVADQEQKQTQNQLIKSKADLRTILDNTEIGYILIDSNLNIASFNERAVSMTRYHFQKPLIEGSNALDYFSAERRTGIADIMKRALRGERIEYEISYPQPDGSFKWFNLLYTGITDINGNSLGLIMSITDINESKLAAMERDRITNDLIRRNKALEQFTYIVSHHLRAPVASILGLAYLFRDVAMSDTEAEEIHKALADATRNLDDIVRDLNEILQVTQHKSEQETEVSLQQLVDSISAGIIPIINKEDVKIEYNFTEIDTIYAVESQLYSIFYNLIINSIKFRRPGVPPLISITSRKDNNHIFLQFSDNGSGIDLARHSADLFGLYSHFNHTAEGRGMGLFMVKTQVDMLNGHISVKSEPDKGTSFLISLPLRRP